ncbi:hypothetical protein ABCR94_00535 [Streptomyces sp. 21So2-11]|uniref:hypothetical protein n=1 Tax=Streptomyces sp. 21So2-11 TaxID=3144408 RepID=UPI00321A8CB3
MPTYQPGDHVSVLYLSKKHGTCLTFNRTVIETEPHERRGQRVWVNMPDDAAYGTPLDFFADNDSIALMDGDPIESQSPAHLAMNLTWHLAAAAPSSAQMIWPHGRHHAPVKVAFTEAARAEHARAAARCIQQWRSIDPAGFTEWLHSIAPTPSGA